MCGNQVAGDGQNEGRRLPVMGPVLFQVVACENYAAFIACPVSEWYTALPLIPAFIGNENSPKRSDQ